MFNSFLLIPSNNAKIIGRKVNFKELIQIDNFN